MLTPGEKRNESLRRGQQGWRNTPVPFDWLKLRARLRESPSGIFLMGFRMIHSLTVSLHASLLKEPHSCSCLNSESSLCPVHSLVL